MDICIDKTPEFTLFLQQNRQLHQEPLELHHEEEGGARGLPARWLQELLVLPVWGEETPPQAMPPSSSRASAL